MAEKNHEPGKGNHNRFFVQQAGTKNHEEPFQHISQQGQQSGFFAQYPRYVGGANIAATLFLNVYALSPCQ